MAEIHDPHSRTRILIIGGGLAGLSTSIALALAGHEIVILERMPVLREIGAGIQLPPNASTLLRAWGILDPIRDLALQPQDVILRSYRQGNVLSTLDFGAPVEDAYGAPYLLIHRADLHRVLLQRARDLGVDIKLAAEIADDGIDAVNACVRLMNGEVYSGDLILGADGERSLCRDLLLGRQDLLQRTGDVIFRFVLHVSELRERGELAELVDRAPINYWMGPNAHVVSYVMRKGDLLNIVLTAAEEAGESVQQPGIQKVEVGELRRRFAGWDTRFGRLLDLARDCSKWSLLHSSENPKWVHPEGKLLLIGDSAHAMLPYLAQGAAQAFEDAAFLGTLFSKLEHKPQIPDLLKVFQRTRLPRTMAIKQRSRDMRDVFGLPDGALQEQRDKQIFEGPDFVGSPIALADPVFQKWLWGYDAREEAQKVWEGR